MSALIRKLAAAVFILAALSPLISTMSVPPALVGAQAGSADGSTGGDSYNSSAGPIFTVPQWSDGGGWTEAEYYATIQLADVDGDGADELLGRGPLGVVVEKWDAERALWTSVTTSGPFPDSEGWGGHRSFYGTIQAADIDGDGSAELLGRSSKGIDTFKWNGSSWTPLASANPNWGNDGDWDKTRFYSTIQTADIDGDGAAELLARASAGIETYKWNGSSWGQLASASPSWSDKTGWNEPQYYSTIQTADVDGDGRAELLARSSQGMELWRWTGTDWKELKGGSPAFSDKSDWDRPQYYRTIQTGDIDGDGADELLARSSAGMSAYKWNGTGWLSLATATPNWGDKGGWNVEEYYATIQTGDVNGDGKAELFARTSKGIDTYQWTGKTWAQLASANPSLSDEHWKDAANYSTIQSGDIDGDKASELVARGLYGIRTWSFDEVTANAWNHPVAYGFTPFAGDQLTAYEFIGTFLTLTSGQDVRGQYTTDAETLGKYQGCLFTGSNENAWNDWTEIPTETCNQLGTQVPITPPSGLTLADWNAVAEQIYNELGQAFSVSTYFSDLTTLYGGIYKDNETILLSTALTLFGEDMSKQKVKAFWENLFLSPFKLAPLGGPVASAVGATASALVSAGLSLASSDSFEGTWADAQNTYKTLTEQNEDAFNTGHAFVAGDPGLMSYVAVQKTSGAWDPADTWTSRYVTSEGRKQFALWTVQTLAPSVWDLRYYSWGTTDECKSKFNRPPDKIQYHYVDENSRGNCYSEVRHASDGPLENILDADTCVPTHDNMTTWDSGSCKLGVPVDDFFLNRNGWNFKVSYVCIDTGSDKPCSALGATMAVQPGSSNKTINQGDPGSVPVAILGAADFDVTQIDIATLQLESASAVGWWASADEWHPSRVRDVNGDGYDDVIVSFPISDLNLEAGTVTLLLTGQLLDGSWFTLWDTVVVNPAVQ